MLIIYIMSDAEQANGNDTYKALGFGGPRR